MSPHYLVKCKKVELRRRRLVETWREFQDDATDSELVFNRRSLVSTAPVALSARPFSIPFNNRFFSVQTHPVFPKENSRPINFDQNGINFHYKNNTKNKML